MNVTQHNTALLLGVALDSKDSNQVKLFKCKSNSTAAAVLWTANKLRQNCELLLHLSGNHLRLPNPINTTSLHHHDDDGISNLAKRRRRTPRPKSETVTRVNDMKMGRHTLPWLFIWILGASVFFSLNVRNNSKDFILFIIILVLIPAASGTDLLSASATGNRQQYENTRGYTGNSGNE
jgi:hypothetical protein